jgi:uncharacterized protein with ParB-like and HNH nuclease domain
MGLRDITRAAVLAAIEEYDQLGQDEFLVKYGFDRARSYLLVYDGKAYDSKAIVGVAHRFVSGQRALAARDFSGGEATVGQLLRRLGFTVQVGDLTAGRPVSLLTKLNVYRSEGLPALYQPITLLWAFARAAGGEPRLVSWEETQRQVAELVKRYGRPGEGDRVYYPVAALYNAGLWDLQTDSGMVPNAHGSSVLQRWFDEHQPRSGLVKPVYELVRDSAEDRAAAVRALTETYFVDADPTALIGELGLSGQQTGSPAEAALRVRAAEYQRLCDRADVFWTGRDSARANRTSADPVHSAAARQAVLLRSEGRCENPDCTGDVHDLTDRGDPILEIDHIHDLALGGQDNPAQMIALCPNCHKIKTLGRTREQLREVLFVVAEQRHSALMAGVGHGSPLHLFGSCLPFRGFCPHCRPQHNWIRASKASVSYRCADWLKESLEGLSMGSITPDYRTIKELLQARSFAIDDYQREYKWETKNIEELVSDLLVKFQASYHDGDAPRSASKYADYFLGSIIVTKRDEKNYLVDGQQRVTSLTLLLIYLYRVAEEHRLGVASTIKPLIFSDNFGEPQFNLGVPERLPALQALFDGDDYNADGKDESVQNMVQRYLDIQELDLAGELKNGLETFIYWLINKVGLIEISAETDAHAYSIFETMNDRGKPLSPVDMLKAYLLAPIEDDEQRAAANRTWKQTVQGLISWGTEPDTERDAAFVKAWLRAKYAQTIRDRKAGAADEDWERIGTVFHRWIRDKEARVGVGDAGKNRRLMTEEFPFFARAYQLILEASTTYTCGLEPVFYNAHNDFTWQPTVLLAPLTVDDDDETVRRKLAATATYLDIWLMRRTVNYIRVGYSSVSYAMWRLCRDIRDKPLSGLIDTLKEKLASDDDEITFEGSPSRGRHGISQLGLNQFSRRYIYHLLARLTAYTEMYAGKHDLFDKYVDRTVKNPYDIEHIWPDDFDRYAAIFETRQDFDTQRNDVSALLLLPADVNRSLQDKPFEEKVPHYVKQNLYAASLASTTYQHQPQFKKFIDEQDLPFHPYEHFGTSQQYERSKLVLALANRIWSPELLEQYRL